MSARMSCRIICTRTEDQSRAQSMHVVRPEPQRGDKAGHCHRDQRFNVGLVLGNLNGGILHVRGVVALEPIEPARVPLLEFWRACAYRQS